MISWVMPVARKGIKFYASSLPPDYMGHKIATIILSHDCDEDPCHLNNDEQGRWIRSTLPMEKLGWNWNLKTIKVYNEPLVGELKIVAFLEGEISVVADCITSRVTSSDAEGFLSKLKLLKGKHTHLSRSFIFSSAGYDDDLAEQLNKMEGMGLNGTYTPAKKGRFSGLLGGGSSEVTIELYEETEGKKMAKVYP